VLPFDVGAFPGSGQSINYLYGPVLLDAEALLTSVPSPRTCEGAEMITNRWQKPSYCQEGDACVHISTAFAALLKSL
jgi:hypothetical protein